MPDFVKALDIDHALQPEVTVAYSMNGGPLPALNGFPARLVVPGWYATYWVKSLHKITVLPHALRRLLDGQGVQDPGDTQRRRRPASELDRAPDPDQPHERSLVRHVTPSRRRALPVGRGFEVTESPSTAGAVSGASRSRPMAERPGSVATLGDDLGRYSFRRWRYRWTPASPGRVPAPVPGHGR